MSGLHFLWAAAIPSNWLFRLATLFGAGNARWAPGTVGSVLGLIWYVTVFTSAHGFLYVLLMAASLYFAAGICGEAASRMQQKDPKSVILDEFVAIPVCFMGLDQWVFGANAWLVLLLGFGLFRLFDITKPLFIGRLDKIEGGWGILLDDVAAAIVTCFLLHMFFTFGLLDLLMSQFR
jgi:phosphatidylglycerophosphatase A